MSILRSDDANFRAILQPDRRAPGDRRKSIRHSNRGEHFDAVGYFERLRARDERGLWLGRIDGGRARAQAYGSKGENEGEERPAGADPCAQYPYRLRYHRSII